jgi:hypothetical protein
MIQMIFRKEISTEDSKPSMLMSLKLILVEKNVANHENNLFLIICLALLLSQNCCYN